MGRSSGTTYTVVSAGVEFTHKEQRKMTASNIQTIEVKKLGVREIKHMYKDVIRPSLDWANIRFAQSGLYVLSTRDEIGSLYVPWSMPKSGRFFGNKYKINNLTTKLRKGEYRATIFDKKSSFIVFRTLAITKGKNTMLLDGCHRMIWLYMNKVPFTVILDTLRVTGQKPLVLDQFFLP